MIWRYFLIATIIGIAGFYGGLAIIPDLPSWVFPVMIVSIAAARLLVKTDRGS